MVNYRFNKSISGVCVQFTIQLRQVCPKSDNAGDKKTLNRCVRQWRYLKYVEALSRHFRMPCKINYTLYFIKRKPHTHKSLNKDAIPRIRPGRQSC